MLDVKICEWLLDNADTPIRYRVLRELLKDKETAKGIEKKLLETPVVMQWLKNLQPEVPPQHHWIEHGSFDFCLENAILKAIQLGLHAEIPQVTGAVTYYVEKIESNTIEHPVRDSSSRSGFDCILTSNLLSLAGIHNPAIRQYMLSSLDELYYFVSEANYDIYATEEEKMTIRGIPKIWRERKVIKHSLLSEHGYCFPLLYDIIGLHTLYVLNEQDVTGKINAIIDYISTDIFHDTIQDGYGIMSPDNIKYYAMGWDPKYPGWNDVQEYLKGQCVPKLLFYAQFIARYPTAQGSKWFKALLHCLGQYQTDRGTYLFPSQWLKESQGYAVLGSHLSFGENRRKKNWREIESTFFMQLLQNNACDQKR